MKTTDFAMIFVAIILPVIIVVYVDISFMLKAEEQKLYYTNIINSAINDATYVMKTVEGEEQDVDYGCAIVVDGNGKEYALVDLLLSRALVLIAQDSQTSGVCYDCVQHNRECEYLTKGQLNDLSGEK